MHFSLKNSYAKLVQDLENGLLAEVEKFPANLTGSYNVLTHYIESTRRMSKAVHGRKVESVVKEKIRVKGENKIQVPHRLFLFLQNRALLE